MSKKSKNKKPAPKTKEVPKTENVETVLIRRIDDVLASPESDWKVDYKSLFYDIAATIQAIRKFNGHVEAVVNNHGEAIKKLQGDDNGDSLENGTTEVEGTQEGGTQKGSVPTDTGTVK